jgi:excinuclease ABC subunit B
MATIKDELKVRLDEFYRDNRLVEAQRLEQRTMFDLEMILELGYCNGIENYSRHLTGKPPGAPPPNLLDYFPDDYLLFIDESHIGIGQLNGMYNGDRSRRKPWSTSASACPRPSTTGRCASTSSSAGSTR